MRKPLTSVWALGLLVWCLCAVGCDGGHDEDQPVDAGQESLEVKLCRDTIYQLCTRSCNCAAQAANCMYYDQLETRFTQYDVLDDCIKIEGELNCIGNLFGIDFNACLLALPAAPCGELFGEPGVELPAECDAVVQWL